METAARRRLGDIFVERGLITDEQLKEALAKQCETGGKLGETLVDLGFVDRVALAGVIGEQWDELRVTEGGRAAAEREPVKDSQVEALTQALAERDRRIAQQDATIAALIAQLPSAASWSLRPLR
jgi:hypothetical protein